MRVKICGITGVDDAAAAVKAGADAIGLNFVSGPRRIDPDRAREILQHLPPMVTPVALVRLEQGQIAEPLRELLSQYRVSHLQLYGQVTAEILNLLIQDGLCPMPVVKVKDQHFTEQVTGWGADIGQDRPSAIVLDAYDPNQEGGTGTAFSWDWVASARKHNEFAKWPPIVLAGGLNPDNVREAIQIAQPYAVDVSSGVEVEGSPGTKDAAKMRAFVRNAKSADS